MANSSKRSGEQRHSVVSFQLAEMFSAIFLNFGYPTGLGTHLRVNLFQRRIALMLVVNSLLAPVGNFFQKCPWISGY
ncbi:hypothetical protein [Hyphomicrobium sp.]|uniref:hypothetical protein n=1 Tax=Hyphomicrobium sp. TaxID=82 RepID=UPI001DBB36EC|nr:hypothetical protein [Hyphomicrobium sp.]MBY0558558.1 hypothetical protein [Hyphomicrobium sp.]